MAASEDDFILEIFLNGCFPKAAVKIYSYQEFLHIFYISYFDIGFFLRKGFGKKCKHTELALNFVQKQYFSLKKTYFSVISVK